MEKMAIEYTQGAKKGMHLQCINRNGWKGRTDRERQEFDHLSSNFS